jgi:hypothetical protein
MTKQLPDPAWTEAAELCVGCGYCLRGLEPPGRCPECGVPFEGRQLLLYGVPHRAASRSNFRTLSWIALAVIVAVFSQCWPLVLLSLPWYFAAAGAGLLLAWLIAMVATSRRERRGAERFVISPAGIARLPLNDPADGQPLDTTLIPWGAADGVLLKRVSPFWRRLQIGVRDDSGRLSALVFEAGVRCPDAAAEEVLSVIRGYLGGTRGGEVDGEIPRGEGSRPPR